ncbi:hypothetical protein [Micromonospora sp. NPDC048830]|uniref:hypothetical protein n=1 Tax=Micromonospora sp. NPDC048830 TaxID=3364257 RepID=UPI003710892E
MSETGQPGAATPGEHGDGTGQQDDLARSGNGWAPSAAEWASDGDAAGPREGLPWRRAEAASGWAASSPRHGDLPAPLPAPDAEPPTRINGHPHDNGVSRAGQEPSVVRQTPVSAPPVRQTPVSAPPVRQTPVSAPPVRETDGDRLAVPAQRPAPAVERSAGPPHGVAEADGPARHASEEPPASRAGRWSDPGIPSSAPPAVQVPPVGTAASGFEVPPGLHAPVAERSGQEPGPSAGAASGWTDRLPPDEPDPRVGPPAESAYPSLHDRPAYPAGEDRAGYPPAADERATPPEPGWAGPDWNRPSWGGAWAPPWSREEATPVGRRSRDEDEPVGRRSRDDEASRWSRADEPVGWRSRDEDEPVGRRSRDGDEPVGRRSRDEGEPVGRRSREDRVPGWAPEPNRAYGPEPNRAYGPEPNRAYEPEPGRAYEPEPNRAYGPEPGRGHESQPDRAYEPEPGRGYEPARGEPTRSEPHRGEPTRPYQPLRAEAARPYEVGRTEPDPRPGYEVGRTEPDSRPGYEPAAQPDPEPVDRPAWAGRRIPSAPAGPPPPVRDPAAAVDPADVPAVRPFRLRRVPEDTPPTDLSGNPPTLTGAGPAAEPVPGRPDRGFPASAPTSTPPYAARRSAPDPTAPVTPAEEDQRRDLAQAALPQRVPAEPDVPVGPEPSAGQPPAEAPQLARIATHLRRDDEPAPPQERPEGFDVNAILDAVRGVAGVRDASLRRTPAGAHSLRLDLADGADAAEVSRLVARLLQERMGLAAAPQNVPGRPSGPPPPVRRRTAEPRADNRGPEARTGSREGRTGTDAPTRVERRADTPGDPPRRRRQGVVPRGRAAVEEPGQLPPAVATAPAGAATGSPATLAASYSGGQLTTTETAPSRPLDTGGVPGPRVVIDHVQVSTFGLDANVEVRLLAGTENAAGYATGPAVDGYVLRLCAVAAAAAVDQLLRGGEPVADRGRCFVEHAAVLPFGNCEVATVVVLLVCHGWVEQLAGSALVAGDPRQAIVRATLSAVNRRLEALLA